MSDGTRLAARLWLPDSEEPVPAILEYLEATRPTPPLVPPDPHGRARVAMHMKLCDLEFAAPARTILLPKRFLPRDRWILEPMEKARVKIEKHLAARNAP